MFNVKDAEMNAPPPFPFTPQGKGIFPWRRLSGRGGGGGERPFGVCGICGDHFAC